MGGYNFAPRGYALCQGQILPIAQNTALFSILGTTYGGNGTVTFGLPDLRGRAPLHPGTGNGGSYVLGESAGEENHTLIAAEIPAHTHLATASADAPDSSSPVNAFWAAGNQFYAVSQNGAMAPAALGAAGGGQPHSNMQPFLVVNFYIALEGVFPSRN